MKKLRENRGFWATISIAAVFGGTVLSVAYFNPAKSVTGLLVSLAIIIFWLVIASKMIDSLYRDDKKSEEKDSHKEAYASSEAVNAKDDLGAEFHSLVSVVARRNARAAGKMLTHEEADSEKCPADKLISPEDMEKAFWEAAKLVSARCDPAGCSCKTNCDKQTLLQRIQRLRKEYEEKS